MNKLSFEQISQATLFAFAGSVAVVAFCAVAFFMAEPSVSRGQASDTASFYVRQTITGESSFLVNPSNVTMAGDISGLTGGQATGTTQFVVISNNSSGYYVEIAFENNGTEEAMIGDVSASEAIRDYGAGVTEPTYNFTASTAAQFAYSVAASTSNHADQSFLSNGTNACNTGSTPSGGGNAFCWKAPTTSAFQIIDTTSASVSGATSTLYFSVVVPSGADPTPVADTYTATATLSLFDK